MTPFEKGYLARRQGAKLEDNPFDPDAAPWSYRKWNEGWKKGSLCKCASYTLTTPAAESAISAESFAAT